MSKKTYAIMGASGQIGHIVAHQLLKKGHQVKAIGRDPKKLEDLKSKGAEVITMRKFDDEETLTRGFIGVDGVFALIPPGHGEENFPAFQDRVGEAIKIAVQKNSPSHLVFISSIGGELSEGTGPIKGLHRQEERLKTLKNLNVINLRPAFFMENLLHTIPGIKQTGRFQTPLLPELPLPMVSTDDIGLKAAEFLDQLNFKGQTVFDFAGPRDKPLMVKEIVKILGNAIGKPNLEFVHQSYEEAKKDMLAAGMKLSLVELYIEMYKAFNANKVNFTQQITPEHRGKTTVEHFAEKFVREYKQIKEKIHSS